jgi:predicted PurR-regulated permease PerM
MDAKTLERWFVVALLAIVLTVVYLMFRPFLSVIFLSAVLAVVFEPIHLRITKRLKSPSLSAFITLLIVIALVVLPLSLFGSQLVQEAAGMLGYLTNHAAENGFSDVVGNANELVQRIAPSVNIGVADIAGYAEGVLAWLVQSAGLIFAGVARFALSTFLFLLLFFYLVRDGAFLKKRLVELSPLSDTHEKEILRTLGRAINSVVRGSLVIAVIQGLVAAIGFTIFDVPNPALWSGVLVVSSFVPTVGTALVNVPIVLYLFLSGDTLGAVGLAIWAFAAVGLVDNFLGPHIIGRGTRLHPLLTLFAVLGGIGLFGPIGLLAGPVIMSLLLALLHIYLQVVRSQLKEKK